MLGNRERANSSPLELGKTLQEIALMLANRPYLVSQMTHPRAITAIHSPLGLLHSEQISQVEAQHALPRIIAQKLLSGEVVVVDDRGNGIVVGMQQTGKNEITVSEIHRYHDNIPEKTSMVVSPSFHFVFSPKNALLLFAIDGIHKANPPQRLSLSSVHNGGFSYSSTFTIAASTGVILTQAVNNSWMVDGEHVAAVAPWTRKGLARIMKRWPKG